MTTAIRIAALLAVIGPLAACAGQDPGASSLFTANAAIDMTGENALAHPWTAAGLPDEDSRAFVLAVDPASAVTPATIKLPSGNSGVIVYGERDKNGCRSIQMEADFRGRDGKAHRGEQVTAVLCPPSLFGSWSATTVTETAQARIEVPRTASLAVPPRRAARPTHSTRNGAGPAGPQTTVPPSSAPEPSSTATDIPDPPAERSTTPPEKVIATAPSEPAMAAPPPAPALAVPPPKPEPAPWKPAVQTDL